MRQRLTLSTAALLTVPPALWAGNAVAGRMVNAIVPPMTLNFLRWSIALLLLLPIAHGILRREGPLWPRWRRFMALGFFGIGCYNALQYLALKTSTPINVTLVAGSMPVFMVVMGALFFRERIAGRQLAGAALSIAGVLLVLTHGHLSALADIRFVPGDLLMLLATALWSWYSWLLAQPGDPPEIRSSWSGFLVAQLVFGVGWSGVFAATEWAVTDARIQWGWPLAATLAYVAIGPAIIAYRAWGVGVQRVGPSLAAFFSNLTPLFAALLSAAFLGEWPSPHHAAAFVLIVAGIVVSSKRS